MKWKRFVLVGVLMVAAFGAACSSQGTDKMANANTAPKTDKAKNTNTGSPATHSDEKSAAAGEETPPAVKAAFPDAQSITELHKDLTAGQIATIEKESGAKLGDTDFHNYVAYGTKDGKRAQLGAATVVEVQGADEPVQLVVVYSNDIAIKSVAAVKGSGDVVAPGFLAQFIGKDHDEKFHVGEDLKYSGSHKAAAEAVAHALKRDILAMQTLYGKAHGH
ncbi:MAG: hypothetical protein HY231_16915 [Acidobacteria bacterium]|nr:hypothetical protein [Acidobacteriota bacterium]